MNVKKRWLSMGLGLFLLITMLSTGVPVGAEPMEEAGGSGAVTGYIALTFDDGPSGRITRRLLEGLEARNARATFFLCGYRLEQYPELAPLIVAQGHEIGLHGYSHKSMRDMDRATLEAELEKTQNILLEQTGQVATLLRPPGGCCSKTVSAVAEAQALTIITWSLDPKDWANHDTATLTRRTVSRASDGDVILMHDMWNASVDAALTIIDQLQAQGYVFVTVSELATLRAQELCPGQTCSNFYP